MAWLLDPRLGGPALKLAPLSGGELFNRGSMVRRVIKPFAVEVKSSGRKPSQPAKPVWPHLEEQPHVEWPEIVYAAAHQEPAEAEPYRDPRKPPPVFTPKPDDRLSATEGPVAAAVPADKPSGRILPVIVETAIVAEVQLEATAKRVKRTKLDQAAEPAAVPTAEEPALAIDTKAVAATIVLRQGRKGLGREEFRRGERWKARLPAAALRAGRKHGRSPRSA